MTDNPKTTREDRVPHMRQTWKEITESDNGECQMMADYRWACDEIEYLRRYSTMLETVKGAFEEQAERWRKRLIELQGYVDA